MARKTRRNVREVRGREPAIRRLALGALWALVFAATLGPAPAAPVQDARAGVSLDLVELVRTPGVAGYEEPVRERLAGSLPDWADARVDGAGNLTVTFGRGAPHILVVAPLDQPGHVVSDITPEGYLRLYRATGSDNRLFDQYHYGQPVIVRTGADAGVPGVSATMSTHIRRDLPASERDRIRDIDDLWIDLGADSLAEVEGLGVRNLDPVMLRDRAIGLAGGRVAGTHAQGRAAAAALQHLLAGRSTPPDVEGRVTLAWVSQSTFRGQGLRHLARRLQPERAVVFTTARLRVRRSGGDPSTGAVEPLTDRRRGGVGDLGGGVLIGRSDETLRGVARRSEVAFQAVEATRLGGPVAGGPDGWAAARIHNVALPVRYAQTPVEMVDADDVASATRLLAAVLGFPDADPGTGSRVATEALGIALGDPVTVPKRFQTLAGARATGRGVDDRVGTTALLLALQRLEPEAVRGRRVTFAWSIEEEVGLHGAETIAGRTRPDMVFAVDTFVSSASPVDWQRRARVPLGAGPVVKGLDGNHVTPRSTVDRIVALGERHGIPVNLSITGGGTDAGAFIPYGAVPVPIGWPSRYSHSPVELLDRADLDDLVDLVLALAYEY